MDFTSSELTMDTVGRDADLEKVLSAWHVATLRLQETHETLRDEVRRLTDELETVVLVRLVDVSFFKWSKARVVVVQL